MKPEKIHPREYDSAAKAVEEIHKFYLIVFVYILMLIYLHWLDLRDGNYDWAYWPGIGFTISLVWFALVMLPSKFKSRLIQNQFKELKTKRMNPSDDFSVQEYETAKKRVEDKLGFYIHLAVYILANTFLVILCLSQGGYFWAIWPIFGWGIGIFSHGWKVFHRPSGSKWKEQQIRKEMERQRKLKGNF